MVDALVSSWDADSHLLRRADMSSAYSMNITKCYSHLKPVHKALHIPSTYPAATASGGLVYLPMYRPERCPSLRSSS